jgi:hypothetical protein
MMMKILWTTIALSQTVNVSAFYSTLSTASVDAQRHQRMKKFDAQECMTILSSSFVTQDIDMDPITTTIITTNIQDSSSDTFSHEVASIMTTSTMEPPPAGVSTIPVSSPPKSYLDDGFVFGLEGSGLDRPKGKVSQLVVEGDSLETTPWQRFVVWGTILGHGGFFLPTSFLEMLHVNHGDVTWTIFQAVLLMTTSWILADFGSGVLHWSVDNYGNGRTPIMGGIIAAFQGHHSARKFAFY